jgi:hypothetical protein
MNRAASVAVVVLGSAIGNESVNVHESALRALDALSKLSGAGKSAIGSAVREI